MASGFGVSEFTASSTFRFPTVSQLMPDQLNLTSDNKLKGTLGSGAEVSGQIRERLGGLQNAIGI